MSPRINMPSNGTDLISLIDRLGTLHKAELRAAAARHNLPLVQLETLHYLDRCNRYSDTPSAITEYLGLTRGTVSQTIRALAKKSLVIKEPDANDGRVVHCVLSRAGRVIVDDTQPPRQLAQAIHPLTEAQATAAEGALLEVLRKLQQMRGERTFGSCPTCRHLQKVPTGSQCGVTGDLLRDRETSLVCREHEPGT